MFRVKVKFMMNTWDIHDGAIDVKEKEKWSWYKSNKQQDHQRWKYHRRLLDYQSPFFQLKFPFDHRIPGIIKFLWNIKVHTLI